LWFEVLSKHETRPVVLFMVRKPSEVSASIETRNCWRPLVGKLLWLRYMTEAVVASRDVSRGVVLYEDLLMDPVSTVTTALSLLGTPVGQGLSPEGREAVAGFVDISDRHHTNPDSEESPTVFDTLAGELYESLVGVARGSKRWNAVEQATEAFDREWRRSGACVDAVADMAARIEAGMQEAKVEKQRVTSALNAQISWSEEAQAKLEALQVDNAELSSKFNAQIRWSEEAQAKLEALQVDNAELSSKFNAQVRWSEEAQAKLEVLQAQNAELFARLVEKTNEHERVKSDSDRWQEESRNLSARLQQMVAEAAQVREKMAALEAQLQNATAERDQIAAQLEQVRINHLATEAELREVYSSTSWKSTKLLRAAARIFRHEIGPADSSTRKPE
jgi:predicted nuclease with TOPRIM domain